MERKQNSVADLMLTSNDFKCMSSVDSLSSLWPSKKTCECVLPLPFTSRWICSASSAVPPAHESPSTTLKSRGGRARAGNFASWHDQTPKYSSLAGGILLGKSWILEGVTNTNPQLRSPSFFYEPSQLKIGNSQREIPTPPDQDQLVHPPLLRCPVKVSTLPWQKHLDEVDLKWIG